MTTEVKTVSTVEQTPQQPLENQSKQSDKDITVFSGMTVNDVVQNGSDAQKIVAEWFANYCEQDGMYDKKEAELFNSYKFTLDEDKKEFNARCGETNITIKYNDIDEIKKGMRKYIINNTFEKGTVVFDLRNETAVYEDIQSEEIHCPKKGVKTITIRNANVSYIEAEKYHGTLKLEGVADRGYIWDSKTDVWVAKDATVSVDEECMLNITRIEK